MSTKTKPENEATNTKPTRHEAIVTIQPDPVLERLRTAIEANEHGIHLPEIHEAGIQVLEAVLTVYVPSTARENEIISQRDFTARTDDIGRHLCRVFGGCTVIPAVGYWLNEAGIMIHERINLARSQTKPDHLAEHYDDIVDMAMSYGRLWHQEAMALSVNGTLITIDI